MRLSGTRGLAIPLVVIFLLFAAALAFALQQVMVQQRAQGVLSSQKLVASSLAHSATNLASIRLNAMLDVEDSPLRLLLKQPGGLTSMTDIGSMIDVDTGITDLKASVPGSSVKVSVKLGDARPLIRSMNREVLEPSFGFDPLERRFDLRITVDASYGPATIHREVVKEVRYQSLSPGSFGKFTLWADQLSPEDGNSVKTDFEGNALDEGEPLVLHNNGTGAEATSPTDRLIYQKRGYVYLGGNPVLHITAGFANLGELFTFLKPGDLMTDPPVRVPAINRQNLPPFFAQQYPQPVDGTRLAYKVISSVYGYFNGPDSKGRTMSSFLPSQTNPLCAGLHLYGTWEDPSPTLVLGQVSRSYCLASGILLTVLSPDAGGSFVANGASALVSLLPDLGRPSGFPAGAPTITSPVEGLPTSPFAGSSIDLLPAGVSLATMFPTAAFYEDAASGAVLEPYLGGYNHFYRADVTSTSFTPTDPIFPMTQDMFQLPAEGPNPQFKGLASTLGQIKSNPEDPIGGVAPIMRERAVYRVSTLAELFEVFGKNDELFLGAPVLIERPEDTVELGDVKIGNHGGGAIILDSRAKATPSSFVVKSFKSLDTGAGLLLCPLNGDVRVDFSSAGPSTPYALSVLAPAGQLKPTGGVISMEGSLVVKRLDLDDTARGGDLYHDPRLDPTADTHADTYRVYVSDDEQSW